MSRKSKYNVDEVIRILNKKYDCKVVGVEIQLLQGKKAKHDLGNGSYGKIDFLVNYRDFRKIYVESFNKRE